MARSAWKLTGVNCMAALNSSRTPLSFGFSSWPCARTGASGS